VSYEALLKPLLLIISIKGKFRENMMKKLFLICLVILLTLPLLAQEDDEEAEPSTREDNECYAGGTMEGRCNQDVDGDGIVSQAEVDWAWNCGWYMARYNDGVLSRAEVPSWCAILLPPLSERDTVQSNANCLIAGLNTYCLTGNSLAEDQSSDGTVDNLLYLISDTVVGNGGNCPAGTFYFVDISMIPIAALVNWLYGQGFSSTDDVCM
jgi:hypothetical protein